MRPTRRAMMAGSAAAAAGMSARLRALRAAEPAGAAWKIAMCDWSLGKQHESVFELARQIGLDGVQISLGDWQDPVKLRRPEVQKAYLEASKQTGVAIASMGLAVLNEVPLMSEPRAALWVADAIEVAKAIGVKIILMAFFSKGELKEENKEDMRRVTEALVELAPRAAKAGVVLGIESYLSAEAHLKILEEVKSPAVQVYYDTYNADHAGHDPLREIKLLGKHICEVHFKEGPNPLGGGKIDWPAVAAALKEVGYRGWLVLETSCPTDPIADTRKNREYLRRLFAS